MEDIKKVGLIKPPIFIHSRVNAFFSTNSFNNGLDNIAKLVNIPKDNIYLPIQKHTNNVHVLEADLKPIVADAVLTEKKGILIGVQVADCVPILLYDKEKNIIGVVHAGWRGTAAQILKHTLETMQYRFHCSTEDILTAIGPSIRQCCYSVGDDVKDAIQKVTGKGTYYHEQDNKCFVDLSSANVIQALSTGIPQQNIWQSDECTFCNPDRFYSYRYVKGPTGRQGGFIGIF